MIPLKNAHISGGWKWDKVKKSEYANYIDYEGHLIAVSASANRHKGAKSPDEWKPSNQKNWCDYATDWVAIKNIRQLDFTKSESDAIKEMLDTCESSNPTSSPIPTPTSSQVSSLEFSEIDCKGNPESVVVSNIFSSGLNEYDNTLVFLRLDETRKFFNYLSTEVSGLIIKNKSSVPIDMDIKYPFYLETWRDQHALLFEWISIQRWPAYIMFGLISLVGLVNLVAAISMIIIEKSHQIGILYAQGFTRRKLQKIFIYQGGFIGLIGSLIGGLLSIIIIFLQKKYRLLEIPSDIYFMDQIPFSFNYPVFFQIVFCVLIFSLFISWFPTKSISSIRPSKLLRYE